MPTYPQENCADSLEDFLDDSYLQPVSKERLLDHSDEQIVIDVVMDNLGNGINCAFFNNITYTAPKVAVLATALNEGDFATNDFIYGNINAPVLQKDAIVQWRISCLTTTISNPPEYPEYPMIRDTVFYFNPQSYIVLRFKADNPGVWFFHYHIEWHLEQGLAIVLIKSPEEMQKQSTQASGPDNSVFPKGRSSSKGGFGTVGITFQESEA